MKSISNAVHSLLALTMSLALPPAASAAQNVCLSEDTPAYELAEKSLAAAQLLIASRPGRVVEQNIAAAGDRSNELRDLLRRRDRLRADAGRSEANPLEVDASLANIEESIEQLAPGLLADLVNEPRSARALQAALASDQGLLLYVSAPEHSYAWYLDSDCLAWTKLTDFGSAAATPVIDDLRRAITPSVAIRGERPAPAQDARENAPAYPREIAESLHRKLLGPFAERLADKREIMLHASGEILSIPFSALIDPATGQFEIENRVYALLPSLRALDAGAVRPATGRDFPILAIGAPGDGNSPELEWLGPLDGARAELESLGRRYPSRTIILDGPQATKTALSHNLDHAKGGLLLFATHALSTGLGESAVTGLLLSAEDGGEGNLDGDNAGPQLLTPLDISRLEIASDLVVLSACDTWAGPGHHAGEALTGLALAFFEAGATNMIVTHWPIADQSAAVWSEYLVAQLSKSSLTSTEAIRASQIALLRDPSGRWDHPRHWAPFVPVIGMTTSRTQEVAIR
ncbi:CHAT domain-containing protein [Erythrobacter sp. KY5]|uniref:CHAT domain-containing protein n=1 Tax=Erythrobacter sp. KY5 TaxID=2011159 RepID=UPI0013A6C37E|nr:CHAT domain-containing protein [Erythrobacter sp. KY5]